MIPFLHIIFPALLCLMAFVGYLVFYLESQQYTARELVLRGLRWHSLACVLAAVLLVAGQSLMGSAKAKGGNEAELVKLREQLAVLEAEKTTLLGDLKLADTARQEAESAVEEAAKAEEKLVAEHAVAMADLAKSSRRIEVATSEEPLVQADVPTKMVAAEVKPVSKNIVADLQRVRRSLGDSINPAYRPDMPSKRAANGLIQEALRRLGSYQGLVNADGAATADAVRAYQAAKALPQTGIVANRTAQAIAKDFEGLYTVAAHSAEVME